jgi:hypothetical protein
MATAQQLEASGLLALIEIELDPDEPIERMIYVWPTVAEWLRDVLPGIETDGFIPGANSPKEQAEALFYEFVRGGNSFEMLPHCVRPPEAGIWVLRTYDLRFFGFFWRKGVFVMTGAARKIDCVDRYNGYLTEGSYRRGTLDLDQPKFLSGNELSDVL